MKGQANPPRVKALARPCAVAMRTLYPSIFSSAREVRDAADVRIGGHHAAPHEHRAPRGVGPVPGDAHVGHAVRDQTETRVSWETVWVVST